MDLEKSLEKYIWGNDNLVKNIILKIPDLIKTYPKIFKFVTDFMEFKKNLRKIIDDNDPRLENVGHQELTLDDMMDGRNFKNDEKTFTELFFMPEPPNSATKYLKLAKGDLPKAIVEFTKKYREYRDFKSQLWSFVA